MKRKRIVVLVPNTVRPRHHAMLFHADLPFRGRRQQDLKQYRRRPRNQRDQDQDTDW